MPNTVSSDLRIVLGDTITSESYLRLSAAFKKTNTSKTRVSGVLYKTKSSELSIFDAIKTTLESTLKIDTTQINTSESSVRLSGSIYNTTYSVLRLYDDPSNIDDGNIGIRELGRVNLANRESVSRGVVYLRSSGLRLFGLEQITLGASLLISGSWTRSSSMRVDDTITETFSSGLVVADSMTTTIGGSLYLWDKEPEFYFDVFPKVVLDGYSTR